MSLYNNYLDQAPTGAGVWLQHRRALAEWRLICSKTAAVQTVLEIGPGHGVFANVVRAAGCAYFAVESNRLIAEVVSAQQQPICLSFAPPLPFRDACVDVIYASHVIEHMPSPVFALDFVAENTRVLRPGGLLSLAAPDLLAFGDTFWDADYTHTFPVTARRLRQLFSDAGLELVTLARFSGPVSGPLHAPLALAARLLPAAMLSTDEQTRVRLERLRLTFMGNLCAIGRKP